MIQTILLSLLATAPTVRSLPTAPTVGLLVVAHGAGPEWNRRVREAVSQVGWPRGPVATAFLMGPESETAGWGAGVDSLTGRGATEIVVVPLMVSSAGAHFRQARYYAGELPELPRSLAGHANHRSATGPPVPIRVTAALDGAPELGQLLGDIWWSLERIDRRRSVVYVAHGPSSEDDAARWLVDLERATQPAGATDLRRVVKLIRDDAAPAVRARAVAELRDTIATLARETADSVTVLPILISSGTIDRVTIPTDLAGLPIRYVPISLAPSPHLARWIERVAEARLTGTDGPALPAGRAGARLGHDLRRGPPEVRCKTAAAPPL